MLGGSTRIACVADVHAANHLRFGGSVREGQNQRSRLIVESLRAAHFEARRAGASHFLVAGDLFDSVHPTPQLVAEVADILAPGDASYPAVFLLPGNHDAGSAKIDDNALAPLARVPGIVVADHPSVEATPGWALFFAPYQPGRAVDWLDATIRDSQSAPPMRAHIADKRVILVTHVGVADDDTNPHCRNAHDAVEASWLLFMMDTFGIDLALLGNWHDHKAWTDPTGARQIVQCGALAPTGFDNPGMAGYGGLILVDVPNDPSAPMTWRREEIPGPRFVQLDADFVGDVEATLANLIVAHKVPSGNLFVEWKVKPELLGASAEDLGRASMVLGLGGFEVKPDAKLAQVQQRAAAHAAATAVQPEDAIGAFLDAMPLDAGVDRERLRARALRCWRQRAH